jgi:hypothetical protein
MSTQFPQLSEHSEAKKTYEKPTIERVNLQVREVMLGACWTGTSNAPSEGACQISGCPA